MHKLSIPQEIARLDHKHIVGHVFAVQDREDGMWTVVEHDGFHASALGVPFDRDGAEMAGNLLAKNLLMTRALSGLDLPADVKPGAVKDAIDALSEARQQIQYLHEKFQATGSGNATLARIESALAALDAG